jgi:hypothetical protein
MTWTPDELARIGSATELEIASRRTDGTLRRFVTIWAVAVGDALYVRSAYGTENPWFRRALRSGRGRVRAGGVERDVTFEAVATVDDDAAEQLEIDAAYHAKYDGYGTRIVSSVVGPPAHAATLRVSAS